MAWKLVMLSTREAMSNTALFCTARAGWVDETMILGINNSIVFNLLEGFEKLAWNGSFHQIGCQWLMFPSFSILSFPVVKSGSSSSKYFLSAKSSVSDASRHFNRTGGSLNPSIRGHQVEDSSFGPCIVSSSRTITPEAKPSALCENFAFRVNNSGAW
jgi:hypothetical protein